jgi:hypothetical protein
MTINRRLEKMETKTQADSNVDDEKVAQLTALLRSLEGVEKIDPTKLSHDAEVIELATLLQRLEEQHKLEYPDAN